jgi:hypothetical protein
MCGLLARYGYFVSGHETLATQLRLAPDVVAVLRHFRLKSSSVPEVVLLTLEYQ